MAYRQKGWSPFTKMDDEAKKKEITTYIKNNMKSFSDADEQEKHDTELAATVRKMSDGKTDYNWNIEKDGTKKVESHDL